MHCNAHLCPDIPVIAGQNTYSRPSLPICHLLDLPECSCELLLPSTPRIDLEIPVVADDHDVVILVRRVCKGDIGG